MGRTALITGASSGIGEATALLFAQQGIKNLVLADVQPDRSQALLNELRGAYSVDGIACYADVSSSESIEKLFSEIHKQYDTLDILVNSAGVARSSSISDLSLGEWEKTIAVNLTGTFLCCQHAFQFMKRQRYGKIVNIASMAARVGGVSAGSDYVASKGGVISLTKSLAKQGAEHQIYANTVAPGYISTPLFNAVGGYDASDVPLKRFAEPREVAAVISFLASDESSYVTGATIDVNGGLYLA